ncbi:MAG TPA: hypothetical protein VMJ10_05505, partial [Kofleriaceae bacterium]|nr:hypothetical protein [Kofleriaceae bacterium]
MKRFDPMFAIGLVLAAGCLEHEQENLPVNPPHGGQSIVSGSGVVGSPPGTVILLTGRVCLITVNVFALGECAGTGVGGLNVALGGAVAVTGDDGTFTIQAVSQPGLVFRVDGDNIVPAAQALQAINIIPTFSSSLFATVIAQNGISIPPAGGSVMASVTNSAGAPMAGVTATSTPVASSG